MDNGSFPRHITGLCVEVMRVLRLEPGGARQEWQAARLANQLKDFRIVATQCDKRGRSYVSHVLIAMSWHGM